MKIDLSETLLKLAEATLENWWQKMRLKNPAYLVEGGPLTHDVARSADIPIRTAYQELEKLRKKGLAIKHGGRGGICRWWPATNNTPFIPPVNPENPVNPV